MGADLATGTGATNTCFSIVDCRTGEKVAEYANPFIRPEPAGSKAVALCWLFKDENGDGARFAWEMQGPGLIFGRRVLEVGYRNIYWKTQEHSLNKKESDQPGWYPGPDNKRDLLEQYRTALQTREFLNRSFEALEECLYFVHTSKGTIEHAQEESGDDPSGARGNHGDRVVADALAWKMAKPMLKLKEKEASKEPPLLSLAWRRAMAERKEREEEMPLYY